MIVADLFAGPGGWDLAAARLGVHPVGYDVDEDTCATRTAAGLITVQADLRYHLSLNSCRRDLIRRGASLDGLIASPPCQAMSAAGAGTGRQHVAALSAAAWRSDWNHRPDPDPNVWLPLEVGRWWETLRPRWVALEQVPAVLPLWEALAARFERDGYRCAVGLVNAEQYGVPQTRERAVLLAHVDDGAPVELPAPTHQRYDPDVPRGDPSACYVDTLFGDPPLQPWLPASTVLDDVFVNTGRDWKPGGSRGDAQTIDATAQPAPALTAKSASQWHLRPATTVCGDARLWPPGHKVNADDRRRLADADDRYGDRAGTDAERLTVEQAARLQTFPADYPWRGSVSSQRVQIGNAVPPLLAEALLRQVLIR